MSNSRRTGHPGNRTLARPVTLPVLVALAVALSGIAAAEETEPARAVLAPATSASPEASNFVESVERNIPRVLVSASLLAWGLLAPEPAAGPLAVLPPGTPAELRQSVSTAASMTTLLTMGTIAAGKISDDLPATLDRLAVTSAVIASSYAVRTYLKGAIQRARPYAAGDIPSADSSPDDFRSFPSGHSLLAWACVGDALVATVRNTCGPWVLPTVTIEALATSALRVAAGEHYVGDVLAGAAIGLLVGSVVAAISR